MNADDIIGKAKERLRRDVMDIEARTDLTEDQKVEQIIKIFSVVCAGVAIQPIPFADIFILTPIQAFMGTRIGAIRGLPVSERSAADLVKELAGVVGLGFLAQQLAIGAYKTVLPFLGAITTIPLVFGLSYAMGHVMDEYYRRKVRGEQLSPALMKEIWNKAKKKGQAHGKAHADEIRRESTS